MLNVLRENFREGPFLKWILVAVGLGMVAYLGNYFVGGGASESAEWAAKVNGRVISARTYVDTARQLDTYYRQLLGQNYDAYRPALQVGRQALDDLINGEIIRQDAERMGLRASPSDVARYIMDSPNFKSADGLFIGRDRYVELVDQRYSGGVSAFEHGIAGDLLSEKWIDLVSQAIDATPEELEEAFRRQTVKTSIRYVLLPNSKVEVDETVSDTTLRAWYDAHVADYRRGEARRMRYIVIEREAQRAAVQVTDDAVRTQYESQRESYRIPEQRSARHILIKVESDTPPEQKQAAQARAEDLLRRVSAGEDFDSLARQFSGDTLSAANGGDIGFFGRGKMVKPFEDAVFGGTVGQYLPVVETQFGYHVIEVTGSRPAGFRPLEEVAAEIKSELETRGAQQRVDAEAARLHDSIGSGARLEAGAVEAGLTVQERMFVEGDRLTELGASPEFLSGVAGLPVGELSAPLPVATGLALVTVTEILPPADQPFDEVRERVRSDVLEDRRFQAAIGQAREALARHSDLDALGQALDLVVYSANDVAPGAAVRTLGRPSPEFYERLYGDAAQVGDRDVIRLPIGTAIYHITAMERFDPARFATELPTVRQGVLRQKRDEYRQALVEKLREQQSVEINHALLQRVSG